ncbi:probable oxidoreductase (short-chain dehydrogenase family) [Natronomonas moolapensis 8.8.11]|uniref:Probable oxidoreductase (Short-chain dehydrogenase family) n=1 Tax=Natronomonas moolapensis (strain DSM 18674 / CECT 7526 / JCM 14361 / 8.8.11) TaxID=268739 RepID=M1XTU3_NATM8|nr:SDR family oxidoreductase [Natronomonas moolapensis]CCQ37914.1 probable oxidoreductase (short-chain dehydrogenase family) [Natronomonas moolapensis 8.8.11]
MSLSPDLSGRTALVTGSAKRVGRELLLRIADCGADVAVHYNESDAAAEATAAEARECGVDAVTVGADVTDLGAVESMFDAVESELGPVDVLVNNVGDFDARHWTEIEWESWRNVVETTFYGTVLCSRRALPDMCESGWGRIVNVGFADSDRMHAHPVNFPYFVAKTGVLMFTRMAAADTQDDGVTVNAVSPFAVENTVSDVSSFPRGRAAGFDDVAAPTLFFLSDAAEYISGENVAVDGGRLPER